MGFYLKSIDSYTLYKNEVRKPYFVDKTKLIEELIPLVETGGNYVCITRPRRFGKSVAANMLGAFFSNAFDSRDIFDSLYIGKTEAYGRHINQHDVIYIDFSDMGDAGERFADYIRRIHLLLREDLHEAYPEVDFKKGGNASEDLKRIFSYTRRPFIFIFDEWDAIFHSSVVTDKDKEHYLAFLKSLLKGKAYVNLAYMTGILPIAKYSSGSELNMFLEYTMVSKKKYSQYFGFSNQEVDVLYEKYLEMTEEPEISRAELKEWYDGYQTLDGIRLYNPRSVVCALSDNQLSSYWTNSGPYDEIFYYVRNNIDDVKDDIAAMIAGEPVFAKVQEYAATAMELNTREEILSAMVVYGFLRSENDVASIPNKELMDKFVEMIRKEPSLGYVYRLARESERMLKATLCGDTDTMEEILEYAHNTESPLLNYSNEAELTAVVNLVYLSARDFYQMEREDKAGIGYVDFIFYPKDKKADGIILELKVDHTPEEAIQQIKDRKYVLRFQGKLGERPQYTGRILAVGIAYHKKDKEHRCKIEVLRSADRESQSSSFYKNQS